MHSGLTNLLYQRDGKFIAFARPDLAVSGTGLFVCRGGRSRQQRQALRHRHPADGLTRFLLARATGVGYANGAGRIASIISPIVVGFLVPMGLTSVFVVLAAGYLLAAIVVLYFGFETKGLVLEKAALE